MSVTFEAVLEQVRQLPLNEQKLLCEISRNLLGRNWLRLVRLGLVDYDGLLYLSRYDEEQ